MNNKLKDFLRDRALTKYTIFIVFTAFLIYALYFTFKNLPAICSGLSMGIGSFLSALSPLFIGLFIAYLFNPLVCILEKKLFSRVFPTVKNKALHIKRQKRNRLFSVLVSYVLIVAVVIAIIYGFAALVLGELVLDSITTMANSLSKYLTSCEVTIRSWLDNLPSSGLSDKLNTWINSFLSWLSSSFKTENIILTIKNIGGGMANLVIGLIISIYLSYDKNLFIGMWNKLLQLSCSKSTEIKINGTLQEVNSVVSLFLRGVLLDALIVAIMTSIGFTILGLKFAVFLGIFAGICNVIPYFGPVLGMIPAFFVGLLTNGIKEGLFAVLVLLIVQQIDGNLIYPRVVGGSTGLHPLFVLLAVTIGGSYGGLLGMIIAVPIAGVLQLFISKIIKKREEHLKLFPRHASSPDSSSSKLD